MALGRCCYFLLVVVELWPLRVVAVIQAHLLLLRRRRRLFLRVRVCVCALLVEGDSETGGGPSLLSISPVIYVYRDAQAACISLFVFFLYLLCCSCAWPHWRVVVVGPLVNTRARTRRPSSDAASLTLFYVNLLV